MKTGGFGKIIQAQTTKEAGGHQGHPAGAKGQPQDEKEVDIRINKLVYRRDLIQDKYLNQDKQDKPSYIFK